VSVTLTVSVTGVCTASLRDLMTVAYAELHALSNFTFLRGASHPEELVEQADALGYRALALTDECSFAGLVRGHVAARGKAVRFLVGSELRLADGPTLVMLATDRRAYGHLCGLITAARRAAPKGEYRLTRAQIESADLTGCLALWPAPVHASTEEAAWLKERFGAEAALAVERVADGRDGERLTRLPALAKSFGLPVTASGDVHLHVRSRQRLQDVLTAIRVGVPLQNAGHALLPNAERCLHDLATLAKRYPRALLDGSVALAERCAFSLEELRYEYPQELVPDGHTPTTWLACLTERGLAARWPGGAPASVRALVQRELILIAELQYEPFFLTVEDLVRFARSRGILCQGRGSAANSAVCYCLGITEVDPMRMALLFERFVSKERDEPPDIDVDFEHERREEVIQYLYAKYGRHRAALAATVISYRPKSALRDVGRALGVDPTTIERLSKNVRWWHGSTIEETPLRECGLDPDAPKLAMLLSLARELMGFPRHLSQHVGGFVIARDTLATLVPVENAAMADRTVIQWDKDDLEDLGLLKVDVLALGMLTAIRKALAMVAAKRGEPFAMADVPAEDRITYDMICRADTLGVFQIESRAQMAMLPRLRPRNFYDLVIEVAIIRPGPIQGGMVHPYLRRRAGFEPVEYPSDAVRSVLERTLGVPIFQEQVMQLAVVAAGFSPGESDQLRRAMAAWKRKGGLGHFEARLIGGMRERGYTEEFAQAIYRQMLGFGEYGFPQSHAASFALLVYVSAWLKCHEPAAFTAALLNSQPMGFYAPAQLVRDAREHGVNVLPVDVNRSACDATLEGRGHGHLRLGLRGIRGLKTDTMQRIVEARAVAPYESVQELAERAALTAADLATLAAGGALAGLAGHRHRAVWQASGVMAPTPLFPSPRVAEGVPLLRAPSEGEDVVADYRELGLTLGRHPLALLRGRLEARGLLTAVELRALPPGTRTRTAGLVLVRQRPGTASGVTFITVEDETGVTNLIVWRNLAERYRSAVYESRLLAVEGVVQREGEVLHLVAERLADRSTWLGRLITRSRDFH
jgi:error-prone DNA polymerase